MQITPILFAVIHKSWCGFHAGLTVFIAISGAAVLWKLSEELESGVFEVVMVLVGSSEHAVCVKIKVAKLTSVH